MYVVSLGNYILVFGIDGWYTKTLPLNFFMDVILLNASCNWDWKSIWNERKVTRKKERKKENHPFKRRLNSMAIRNKRKISQFFKSIVYLYMKENNLLFVCHIEISQTTMPSTMLLASLMKALNVYECIEGVF